MAIVLSRPGRSARSAAPPRNPSATLLPVTREKPEAASSRGCRIVCGPRTALARQGERAGRCIRVVSGVVIVYRLLLDGRRHVTDFLVAGDWIGLADGDRYRTTAESVTDVVAVSHLRRNVEMAAAVDPAFARILLVATRRHLAVAQSQIVLLGSKNALERVASFLLLFARRQHGAGALGEALSLPMRRRDIADHLGLTIETVSRCFTALRHAGAIELPHHDEVTFVDRATLELLAERNERPA